MLDRNAAEKLSQRILALAKADETHVSIGGGQTTHLRFARSSPSTSGEYTSERVSISSVFGKRTGSITINQFDDASLEEAVRRAESIARLAPEDREFMPGLPPQTYTPIPQAFDAETAERGAEKLAEGVGVCLKQALAENLVAAGFTSTSAGFSAIASSLGNFGYHASTSSFVSETARTEDGRGSGWAADNGRRIGALDYAGVSLAATRKARASVDPRPLAPGRYVAILEPACVANLISLFSGGLSLRAAAEGRSYFSKGGGEAGSGATRLGEKLFGPEIELYSDPRDAQLPGSPWGEDGLPLQRVDWIKGGVLSNLRADRYWAQKSGVQPVPGPSNLIMKGGTGTLEELIASTERGVLVTSLWYIRSLDPRTMLYTGLTRDGVFWIEDGKIAYPVQNFRWNESPIAVLKNTVAMSRAVLAAPRSEGAANTVVPALKVGEFNFTSVSEAV